MSRAFVSLLVLAIIAVTADVAAADTFGGWQYKPPPGFTVENRGDHVALTKVAGSTFCSIALLEARPIESSVAAERAYEWHNVVAHGFTAKVTRRATMQTMQGAAVTVTTAALSDSDGNRYAGIHYVVNPPGMIGSVLLTASDARSRAACGKIASSVVRSLALEPTAARTDPEARVETPLGRWASVGPTSREYRFAADGTYRFHSEALAADRDTVVDESGTYKAIGNQLLLTPGSATLATIVNGVATVAKMPLEKTTYTWGKRYVAATNEWRVELAPRKATKRDGKLAPSAGSYQYSEIEKPTWKYAGEPGV